MKFVARHHTEFNMPKAAFCVGFMQFFGSFMCEVACILWLSTIDQTLDVIIKYIALGSIAKIDNFYAKALPLENKVKRNFDQAQVTFKRNKRNVKT